MLDRVLVHTYREGTTLVVTADEIAASSHLVIYDEVYIALAIFAAAGGIERIEIDRVHHASLRCTQARVPVDVEFVWEIEDFIDFVQLARMHDIPVLLLQ